MMYCNQEKLDAGMIFLSNILWKENEIERWTEAHMFFVVFQTQLTEEELER